MTTLEIAPPDVLRPPERKNLAGVETGREHISHSALGTFLACEQRYGWSYAQRLEPAVTAAPLQLGRAFAHALEHSSPEAGEKLLLDAALAEAKAAAESPWVLAPNLDDVRVQATIVREAARAYLHRYGAHEQTREVDLRVRLRNPARGGRYSLTHDLVCRVDAVSDDGTVMIEDKLVGQIPRTTIAQRLRLDRQVTIGCYAIWRATGVEVREVRYRMTLKPQIRQRQSETLDAFLDRIASDYAERPEHYLHEEVVTREPDDFLRLEQELWTWAEQIRQATRTGVWPRNTGACIDHGGCAFLALCAREPGAMHQFRERERRPDGAPAAPRLLKREVQEATHAVA